jgi:hypothetical protein
MRGSVDVRGAAGAASHTASAVSTSIAGEPFSLGLKAILLGSGISTSAPSTIRPVKDAINGAQAEREAAHAEVEAVPTSTRLEATDVYAVIDALDDVGGGAGSQDHLGVTNSACPRTSTVFPSVFGSDLRPSISQDQRSCASSEP